MNLNATLFAQLLVFLILVLFTMKAVWPKVITALDERAEKIASGLAAAEEGKKALALASVRAKESMAHSREEANARMADAERRALDMVEHAKQRASEEADRIIEAARAQAQQELRSARDILRTQVAGLAVRGAEQILRREVNPATHADLLKQLESELT